MRIPSSALTESVTIVRGYLPVDFVPELALRANIVRRLAVVPESPGNSNEIQFDEALYLDLVKLVVEIILPESIQITLDDMARRTVMNAEQFTTVLAETIPPHEPFPEVNLVRDGTTLTLVQSEPWARVGGPIPYHDTYTIGIYSSPELVGRLEEAIMSRLRDMGISNIELLVGEDIGKRMSLARRIRDVFRRKWL